MKRKRDVWVFAVRSDDPHREIKISWEGNEAKLKRIWLEDTVMGERIRALDEAGKEQSYAFGMDGQVSREFKWGYGTAGKKKKGKKG